jgi:ATP-dependent protease HslVU (ClpYQ) ATPase subunit
MNYRNKLLIMESLKVSEEDLKFPIPSNIIVSGPSHSGKTELVLKLVKNANKMFIPPPKAIGKRKLYCTYMYRYI